MASKGAFMHFLSTSDYAGREDLYHMFNRKVDLAKTIGLAWTDYTGTIEYMEKHLAEYCITLPPEDLKWVPCALLKYIHNNEVAYCRRLERFQEVAAIGDQLMVLTEEEVLAFEKGPLGTHFLSWVACFIFIINECDSDEEVESVALPIGGFTKDANDVPSESTSQQKEETWGTLSFPQGLEPVAASPPRNLGPIVSGPLPEHDLLTLSTVVIDDDEFIFFHDIEKQCHLRMDECFSILATYCEFPFDHDDSINALEVVKTIPPNLGEGLVEAVKLVKDDIDAAAQKDVTPEEFAETQAILVAKQATVAENVAGAEGGAEKFPEASSSINVERERNDSDQEVKHLSDDLSILIERCELLIVELSFCRMCWKWMSGQHARAECELSTAPILH